jgi:2-polyprenyl-3-methyl-5-hydroxy-6-metoxy-1,4-benzoquinol methylase
MLPAAAQLHGCPLCAGTRIAPYVVVKGYPYHRCEDCGFAFLNPMPSQLALNDEYQGHKGIAEDHYPHAASRRRKALFRALGLLPHLFRRSVLDIGCGGGFFVDAARRVGARSATGLDVDTSTIAYARRHFPRCEFQCVSFDSFAPSATYDFIYSSEVIEHVQDPHAYLRLLQACSRIGSHVFITTPDLSNPRVPVNPADWLGFAPPAHVGLFTRANLQALFARYGFEVVRVLPPRKTGVKVLFQRRA